MTFKTRILITRSGNGGRQLAKLLAERDVPVTHYAPVQLEAMADQSATRAQIQQCLPVDVLVAPSAEALRQLASLLEPEQLGDPLIVVPGPGTAKIGAQLGFRRIRFPAHAGTSEQILALPELQDVAGSRILIAAAAGGRDLIETRLRARGAAVKRLNVYRRLAVPPAPAVVDQLSLDTPMISLLASGGALLGLRQQLPEACWRAVAAQPMIAPSPRVAGMARAAGCARVVVAGGADDRSMLAALGTLCPSLATISYSVGS